MERGEEGRVRQGREEEEVEEKTHVELINRLCSFLFLVVHVPTIRDTKLLPCFDIPSGEEGDAGL